MNGIKVLLWVAKLNNLYLNISMMHMEENDVLVRCS